jgi:hypothetical protein
MLGPRVYVDECVRLVDDTSTTSFTSDDCPLNKVCINTLSPPPGSKPTIECVDYPFGGTALGPGRQWGVTEVGKGTDPTGEHTVPVTLVAAIKLASVSAFLEGVC